jgi:peptide/nickel transport system permease protein
MTPPVLAAPASAAIRRRAARRPAGARRPPYVLLVVLGLLAILAVAGPWLAPQDPASVDLAAAFQGPSAAHWLGTDASGRDILSRLLAGARTALLAPLVVTLAATVIGSGMAILAAWRRGWTDTVTARVFDILFSFPGLLLAILATAVFGTGLVAPIRERSMPYVEALELQGLSGWRICRRHIVPNVGSTIGAQAAISFSYAIVDLAAVNFLGLGLDATDADWGVMVSSGQSSILRGRPEEALLAGLAIVVTVVAVNLLSQRLEGDSAGLEVAR